jgi:hypothetical protein
MRFVYSLAPTVFLGLSFFTTTPAFATDCAASCRILNTNLSCQIIVSNCRPRSGRASCQGGPHFGSRCDYHLVTRARRHK